MELLSESPDVIQQYLQTLGWLNAGEALLTLMSPGEGNMNRVLRAKTNKRTFILKQSVPYVAKYPDIPAPQDRIDVEQQFYASIAPVPAIADKTPKVLGYDAANRLLALEDLGELGDMTDAYTATSAQPTDQQLTALTQWLSALHHLAADDFQLSNMDMRTLNYAHIFDIPFQQDNGVELSGAVSALASQLREDEKLKTRAKTLGAIYLGQSDAGTRALLHGDYYPGSWLRRGPADVAIIDPEFGFVGAAEFDVGVMLAHITFCGIEAPEAAISGYQAPDNFDWALARRFAAVEIIRRLLGVAQLPLPDDDAQKCRWLEKSAEVLAQ